MAIDRIVTCIFYDHVELSLQHITCDFKASQHHWNAPLQVWSITADGPGYRPTYYPAHFIILTPGRPVMFRGLQTTTILKVFGMTRLPLLVAFLRSAGDTGGLFFLKGRSPFPVDKVFVSVYVITAGRMLTVHYVGYLPGTPTG